MAEKEYYDNSDEGQRFQPGTTAEGSSVDQKFDEIAAGFQEVEKDTRRALKFPFEEGMESQEFEATAFQRRNRVLGFDTNGELALVSGFYNRGDWQPNETYFLNDVVRDPVSTNLYVLIVTSHESGEEPDLDNESLWYLAIDADTVRVQKLAAEDARDAAEDARDTANNARDESVQAANEADASANAASNSASAASGSASNASTSEDLAQQWASEAEDVEVEPGLFSAYHWAQKAQNFGDPNAFQITADQTSDTRELDQWAAAIIAAQQSANDAVARSNHTGTQTLATISDAGTAASKDVTTSATDPTDGRVLKVGDFGLGAKGTPSVSPASGDIGTGFFQFSSGSSPFPSGKAGYGVFASRFGGASEQSGQLLFTDNNSQIYVRKRWGGSLDSVYEIYTQASILGTVSQSGGVPTGAVMERGSNANGEYTVLADGRVFMTREETLSDWTVAGELTFDFPVDVVGATVAGGLSGAPVGGADSLQNYESIRAFSAAGSLWRLTLDGAGVNSVNEPANRVRFFATAIRSGM